MSNGEGYPRGGDGGAGGSRGQTQTGPDPSTLTTENLLRETAGLRELLVQRIDGLDEKIEQKFDLVERQRVEQKNDTKAAVDAALTAQKEAAREQTLATERANEKTEAAFTKQIAQLESKFENTTQDLRRTIEEAKKSIGDVDTKASNAEAQKIGAKEDRTGLYAGIAAIGGLLTIGMIIVGVIASR